MRDPKQNQQKILDFIKQEIELKGYPPSVREICTAVGLKSTSTVHAHLNHLEEQGLIHEAARAGGDRRHARARAQHSARRPRNGGPADPGD